MTNNWKDLIEQYPRFASLIKEYHNDVKGALKHLKNAIYTLPNTDVPISAQLFYQLFGLEAIYKSGVNLSQTIWRRWFEAMPITRQDALAYLGQATLPLRGTLMEVIHQKSNDAGCLDINRLIKLNVEGHMVAACGGYYDMSRLDKMHKSISKRLQPIVNYRRKHPQVSPVACLKKFLPKVHQQLDDSLKEGKIEND